MNPSQQTFVVQGMTCGHCERAVTQAVQRVDPANLAASFGPGIRLKRITVEVTDDDVTTGIEKRLQWLPKHRGTLKRNPPRHLDDPSDPDLLTIDVGPFSTERFQ